VLIALCSDNVLPADCQFGVVDMMRVMSRVDAKSVVRPDARDATSSGRAVDGDLDCLLARTACELGSDGVSAAMESLSTSETVSAASPMDIDIAGGSASSDKHSHLIPVDIIVGYCIYYCYGAILVGCCKSVHNYIIKRCGKPGIDMHLS